VIALREEVARILGDAAILDPAAGVPAWRVEAAGLPDAARRLRAAGLRLPAFMTAIDRPRPGSRPT
jgi:hypothetical protein